MRLLKAKALTVDLRIRLRDVDDAEKPQDLQERVFPRRRVLSCTASVRVGWVIVHHERRDGGPGVLVAHHSGTGERRGQDRNGSPDPKSI